MGNFDKIMVWGDSILQGIALNEITQRYFKLGEKSAIGILAKKLGISVENYSHFGYVSDKGRALMERRLKTDEKNGVDNSHALALVSFGGNDIDHPWQEIAESPDTEHESRTPLKRYRDNLVEMIRLLREKGITPILMNLPLIDDERFFDWFSRGFTEQAKRNIIRWLGGDKRYIYRAHENYNVMLMCVANDTACPVIDVRGEFLKNRSYRTLICSDGIHPNAEGHSFIAKALVENICKKFFKE